VKPLKSLRNRVSGLFSGSRAAAIPKLSSLTVEHEPLDEFIFDDMREHSKRFSQALTKPVEIEREDENGNVSTNAYEQAFDLREDIFIAHHVGTDDVRMMDRSEVKPSSLLHSELMQHFTVHPDFLATRPMTRNDEVGATLATMAAQDTLDEELRTSLKDLAEASQDAQTEEEKIRQASEELERLRQMVRDAKANGLPIDPALVEQIKALVAQRQEAGKVLETIVENKLGTPGPAVGEAIGAAAANAKELTEVYVSLPGVGIGAGQHVQPKQAIELAYKWRNAPNLKRMAELMGRMERDFRYKRSHRVVGGMDEIVGVEVGNDIRRLLPLEFVNLNHPALKMKFYRDFAAKQLLQYEMIGHAEAGKGPVIVTIDASGSMSGTPNEWARAVVLALTSIAHREKRPVYVIEFSSHVTGEWFFPHKGGIDPEVATDFATSFNGGGTDNTMALIRAKEIFDTHPDFKQADLLVITDGSDYLEEKDLELKRYFNERGVRIQGVVIGMDRTPYTDAVCDDSVPVYDLTGANGATDRIVQGLT
jgi:uncharacterized protein with von Willebrand factor type A (vWA) domain